MEAEDREEHKLRRGQRRRGQRRRGQRRKLRLKIVRRGEDYEVIKSTRARCLDVIEDELANQ